MSAFKNSTTSSLGGVRKLGSRGTRPPPEQFACKSEGGTCPSVRGLLSEKQKRKYADFYFERMKFKISRSANLKKVQTYYETGTASERSWLILLDSSLMASTVVPACGGSDEITNLEEYGNV